MTYHCGIGAGLGALAREPQITCDGCGVRIYIDGFPPRWFLNGKAKPGWSLVRKERDDGSIERDDRCSKCRVPPDGRQMNEDLDALEKLLLAATPAPWVFKARNYTDGCQLRERWAGPIAGMGNFPLGTPEGDAADANVKFVALARKALPSLLVELRAARAELAKLRSTQKG